MFTALLIVARAAHIGASILIAGSFYFDVIALRSARAPIQDDFREVERLLFCLAFWSLMAAFVTAVLWFWLVAANMTGLPFGAFSTASWRTVLLETEFGHVWQIRIALIAAALVLIVSALAQVKARRALIAVLWLISVVLLVSLALISHAAAATIQPFGVLGDMIHLCAAGVWVGGLIPVAIFLGCARRWLSSDEKIAKVIERFSTLSLCCVTVLVLSGISNSWLLVGSIHALFTTPYGRLLLVKLALFAILLAFGLRNRFFVKAKLPRTAADPDLLSQLRGRVVCEICLGVSVVVMVACLGVTPPV